MCGRRPRGQRVVGRGLRRRGCALVAGSAGAQAYALGAGPVAKGPAGGLTPADLASAYDYLPAVGGSGQAVGIVDAYDDPHIEADLAKFDGEYGVPACIAADGCLRKVNQSGAASPLPTKDKRGWSLEMSLDVETVHSVCPNCKILLVEADSESLANLAAAVDEAVSLGATEVSNSYGAPETEIGAAEQAAYDHPGVVVTASAGDSGYLDWDDIAELEAVPGAPDAPSSLPSVVAVGGTSLKLSSKGTRKRETVWNNSGLPSGKGFKQYSATGGGCSTLFTAPAWQQSVPGWAAAACGSRRLDNDVAAVADPYTGFDVYDSYVYEPTFTPGWLTVGGTSLSSPLIAALYALAGGSHGVSYPAVTLYAHLGEASALYDVTGGGNGYCAGEAPGPCGMGAPNGLGAFGGPSELAPTAVTEAASAITAASATLNASVDPNGGSVSACVFEYGSTTAYGQSAPCA